MSERDCKNPEVQTSVEEPSRFSKKSWKKLTDLPDEVIDLVVRKLKSSPEWNPETNTVGTDQSFKERSAQI